MKYFFLQYPFPLLSLSLLSPKRLPYVPHPVWTRRRHPTLVWRCSFAPRHLAVFGGRGGSPVFLCPTAGGTCIPTPPAVLGGRGGVQPALPFSGVAGQSSAPLRHPRSWVDVEDRSQHSSGSSWTLAPLTRGVNWCVKTVPQATLLSYWWTWRTAIPTSSWRRAARSSGGRPESLD